VGLSVVSEVVVLHRDRALIVVDKPAGLLSIPGRGPEHGPDLRTLLEAQLGQKVWVVHRLDRGTSGAMAFALDADTHRTLSLAFERGEVHKRYLALVTGKVERDEGTVDLPLIPARRGRMRTARPGEAGKESQTAYRVLRRFESFSWVELQPTTGRQHQIRVHMLALGHPLAVDEDYRGAKRLTAQDLGGATASSEIILARTPLHAARLELPRGKETLTVEAPLPGDLAAALALLGHQ
jgi:tRNA pseudouridine32 synthase/23S rRNA pseudouridine746 synthase/23S rRNA pseudouridine955/2504/2580 synthase